MRNANISKNGSYKHSSAKLYLTGEDGFYRIDNVVEMKDKVFVFNEVNGYIYATSCKGRDVAAKLRR